MGVRGISDYTTANPLEGEAQEHCMRSMRVQAMLCASDLYAHVSARRYRVSVSRPKKFDASNRCRRGHVEVDVEQPGFEKAKDSGAG